MSFIRVAACTAAASFGLPEGRSAHVAASSVARFVGLAGVLDLISYLRNEGARASRELVRARHNERYTCR